MPFDGNGTFNRVYNWQQDAANNIDITASRVDTEDTGFASGLTIAVTRDGQGKMAADFLPSSDNVYAVGNPSFRWGTVNGVNAALVTPRCAVKTASLGRSATTLVIDPDLSVSLPTAGYYLFELLLNISGSTTSTQGVKLQLNPTAVGTTMYSRCSYGNSGGGSGTLLYQHTGFAGTFAIADVLAVSPSINQLVKIDGSMHCPTAGSLALYWGTNSNNGNNTNIDANGYLVVRQLA